MNYSEEFERKIGFDHLRSKIRDLCLSPLGLAQVDKLCYQSDFDQVSVLLRRTQEMKNILEKGDPLPTQNYFDASELFHLASIEGSFIEEEGFRSILLSLESILKCKSFLTQSKESYPELFILSESVAIEKGFVKSLSSHFDDAGKVRDDASHELARLRRRLKEEQGKVRRLTDQIYRQSIEQGWVPEGATPTIREGRLVIPILAEHKRKLRGYIMDESATGQTVFVEPAEALEANNELRDLLFAERREVIRILKELTALIRQNLPALLPAYDFLALIELNYAKAKLALELEATMPHVLPDPVVDWHDARHPILFLTLRGKRQVVPLDINLNLQERYLLISGPNAGGKSVCIKTVSLIQYMAQCGLLTPMDERSTLGLFDSILIDIGDQQSLENDLSTYSSHLKNLNEFIQKANDRTLIVLDELGAGTDPSFGGAIAESILETLIEKKTWGLVTTHYYNLKLFAERKEGIRNASMLFDTSRLEPLFRLEIGKPGSSFALEIARKTGLPAGTIRRAEEIIGKDLTGLETLMKKVSEEKQELTHKQRELSKKESEVNELVSRYKNLQGELDSRKKEIIEKAKSEASYLLKETNKEIEKTIRHIRENKAQKNETRKVRENLKSLEKKVQPVKQVAERSEELKEGDKVRIAGQEVTGTILTISGTKAVVQFGDLRSTVSLKQLVRSDLVVADVTKARLRSVGIDVLRRQSTFDPTLDVRGKRAEEVIKLMDQFLDDAILLSQGELRILHGKGEGILRKVIREKLKTVKAVASFGDEHVDRGGDGITVVILK